MPAPRLGLIGPFDGSESLTVNPDSIDRDMIAAIVGDREYAPIVVSRRIGVVERRLWR